MLAAIAFCGGVVLSGCPTAVAPVTPAAVTRAHVAASRSGDRKEASRWLSKSALRLGLPWPAPREVAGGVAVERSRSALWQLPSGRRVAVARSGKGWRIHAGVLGLDRATTPQQALVVLARVIQSRDYAALLQLLPVAERKHWTAERLATVIESPERVGAWRALAKALASPPAKGWVLAWLDPGQKVRIAVAVPGTKGVATQLSLLKQGDGWKVLDVTPRALYTSRR